MSFKLKLDEPGWFRSQKLSWLKANRHRLSPSDCAAVQAFLDEEPGTPLRVKVVRSIALEPMVPFLKMFLALAGWTASVELGELGQWRQELLEGDSADLTWVVVRMEDLVPRLDERPLHTSEELDAAADEVLAALQPFLDRATGRVAITRMAAPGRLHELAERVNGRLTGMLVELDRVCREVGTAASFDYRYLHMASLPYTRAVLFGLARELARQLLRHTGRRLKCLVLDCDNTLWGGIVGELGDDIALGDTLPGVAYKDFQKLLLHHFGRGVMLALNSRNNPEDVLAVLDGHPHQLLRRPQLVAMELHWGDKAEHLAAIARKLNIGLDAIAFIDDDPVQCGRVSGAHPQVLVLQQAASPLDVPFILAGLDELEGAELTTEDRQRTAMLQQQEKRTELEAALSFEDYQASLGSRLEVFWNDPRQAERALQLARKTNQFKLTPFVPSQLDGLTTVTCSLSDRFGEMGQIGVAFLTRQGDGAELNNLLLSCRALGRGVEQAFLREILFALQREGCHRVTARWFASERNAQTRPFLERCGLISSDPIESTERNFVLDLNRDPLPDAVASLEVVNHANT